MGESLYWGVGVGGSVEVLCINHVSKVYGERVRFAIFSGCALGVPRIRLPSNLRIGVFAH